jgi:hypothetical protein
MPRNKIADLNDHLFEQLERLNDDKLKGDDLQQEINRANAITGIAGNIIGAAKVTVDAMKLVSKGDLRKEDLPGMFKQLENKS